MISEQINGEKYTGQDGKTPGGVPGTASNITNPTYVANQPGAAGKSSDYNKNSTIKNFEVSKETLVSLNKFKSFGKLTIVGNAEFEFRGELNWHQIVDKLINMGFEWFRRKKGSA